MCRRDHGLAWDEFCNLTLAQLEALEERRAIEIRHARHDAAFIVSTLFNLNRGSGSDPLTPYDFLPGFEQDPDEKEAEDKRKAAVRGVRAAFAMQPVNISAAAVKSMKARILIRLQDQGYMDAEDIMREAYPNL